MSVPSFDGDGELDLGGAGAAWETHDWHGEVSARQRKRDAQARRASGGGGGGVAEEPAWEERRCDACERTLRGDAEWRAHVSGRRHRKRVASLRKKREGKHGVPPREKGCSDAG